MGEFLGSIDGRFVSLEEMNLSAEAKRLSRAEYQE